MKKTFTPEQLEDWRAYERIRASGKFNMFEPRARHLTGMMKEEYIFVMDNYSELKEAVEQADKERDKSK